MKRIAISRPRKFFRFVSACSILTALANPVASQAGLEFSEGGVTTKITGGISYGLGVRTGNRDSSLAFGPNAATIGWPISSVLGRNGDDGNLNYDRGDVFSHVFKGFTNVSITNGTVDANFRVQAWNDLNLSRHDVPFGSIPNGYVANTPLSDNNARDRGRFTGVILSNAYIGTSLKHFGAEGSLSAGYQNIGWRGNSLTGGSLAALDPVDLAARNRPGAFSEEVLIPVPSAKVKFAISPSTSVEAFYQFSFVSNQEAICGSFLQIGDRARDGCDKALSLAGANLTRSDAAAISAGQANYALVKVEEPRGDAQFGILLKTKLGERIDATVGISRYDVRRSFNSWYRGVTADALSGTTPQNNPYLIATYPKGVKQLDLGLKHQLEPSLSYYMDYTLKKDQPLSLPLGDLFQSFTSAAATFLRNRVNATPRGQLMQGWDTYTTSDVWLGGSKSFKNVAGASNLMLRAEVNASFVHSLADPSITRFGRPELFGNILTNNTCVTTAQNPGVQCSFDGYTSKSAYAVALNANAIYAGIVPGTVIRPFVAYRHDIKGWSYDGAISQGTKQIRLGVDVGYGGFDFNLTSVNYSGGLYQPLRDKDHVMLSVQKRF